MYFDGAFLILSYASPVPDIGSCEGDLNMWPVISGRVWRFGRGTFIGEDVARPGAGRLTVCTIGELGLEWRGTRSEAVRKG
jgi:hypothetical protein